MTQAPAASLAEANEKVYTSLTYGIALEQDRGGGRKNHTVRSSTSTGPSATTGPRRARGLDRHVGRPATALHHPPQRPA